jgi:hypothetical protein
MSDKYTLPDGTTLDLTAEDGLRALDSEIARRANLWRADRMQKPFPTDPAPKFTTDIVDTFKLPMHHHTEQYLSHAPTGEHFRWAWRMRFVYQEREYVASASRFEMAWALAWLTYDAGLDAEWENRNRGQI